MTKLNELIAGTPHEKSDLETIIKATAKGEGKEKKIFNNAAQVWNHDFFWDSLAPIGGQKPPENIEKHLKESFRLVRQLPRQVRRCGDRSVRQRLGMAGAEEWQVRDLNNFECGFPMTSGMHALWTCDVWEHAYYLDHQQDRAGFVKAVIENLANWQFIGLRLSPVAVPGGRVSRHSAGQRRS